VAESDYKQLIRECVLRDGDFIKATFSGRDRSVAWIKVVVRPVLVQGKKRMQFSYFDTKKDITKNYRDEESAEMLEQLMALEFKNVHVQTASRVLTITVTHKGKAIIRTGKAESQPRDANLSHDRQKARVLTATGAAPFLKAVGIMSEDGKIRADMQSKFRQINEFLKLVQQTGELEKRPGGLPGPAGRPHPGARWPGTGRAGPAR